MRDLEEEAPGLPQTRDFLDRFRPAGSPGAASRTGVPADRAAERISELEPVLALLADTNAECDRIAAAARRDAALIAAEASRQAARIAADAQRRALQAREAAVEQALTAARADADDTVAAATTRAGRLRAAFAGARADRLAAIAVDMILAVPVPGGPR
ncbi:MAG TPA: hypothetical protein VMI33_06000 [Streptosporangiaceae bacterium]|nr:hypothetical protein [Streptosporangiaceae bacterium]